MKPDVVPYHTSNLFRLVFYHTQNYAEVSIWAAKVLLCRHPKVICGLLKSQSGGGPEICSFQDAVRKDYRSVHVIYKSLFVLLVLLVAVPVQSRAKIWRKFGEFSRTVLLAPGDSWQCEHFWKRKTSHESRGYTHL